MSNPAWDDLPTLGKRLNRLIKYSETMLKKTDKDDHDGKNRYISTIVSLSRQQLEIIKIKDSYEEINSYFKVLKQDELAIDKHNMRQREKNNQQAKERMEYEISQEEQDRAEEAGKQVRASKKNHEIEEEKLVRRQAEKMKGSKEMVL